MLLRQSVNTAFLQINGDPVAAQSFQRRLEKKDKTKEQQGRLLKHQQAFFYRKSLTDFSFGKTDHTEI